ncbi:MAG: hypothetical protein J6A04_03090 [Clostridia bacterium]|nr:hypothetical protein [Clostridia bacterium]
MKSNKNGITLVALVITIIVLLILAGITINLTIGQDGILKRAQEAGKNYQDAAGYEQTQLAEFTNQAENIINGLGGNNEPEQKYTMVDGVPVPKGFTHTEGTKSTGFVIKDTTTNADGTPTLTNGNEYVWVPVDDTTSYSYDRYAFTSDDWEYAQTKGEYDSTTNSYKIVSDSYYTEAMPSIDATRTELDSVNEYKGFYIGRYEVGVVGYDSTVSTSPDGTTTWTGYSNGTAVIQQGKQVWNWITRDKAREVAESMYSDNDAVISRLCSSYAWDTALKFIETQNSTYPTNSVGGYYSQSAPTTTGYDTVHPCNIYDMGGNVFELTTEVYSSASIPYVFELTTEVLAMQGDHCTIRGGFYDLSASDFPAAYRSYGSTPAAAGFVGFRSTLYL